MVTRGKGWGLGRWFSRGEFRAHSDADGNEKVEKRLTDTGRGGHVAASGRGEGTVHPAGEQWGLDQLWEVGPCCRGSLKTK